MIFRMRLFLALLALLLTAASAPVPIEHGRVQVCDRQGQNCAPVWLVDLRLSGPETHIQRVVTVDPRTLDRPLTVWITAMASAEVRWNGVLIGRNGVPGPDRASERPGRFIAAVTVPKEMVRPGANLVSLRLSAHHLWLPVRRTVHAFYVTPYETPALPGLASYLPAMLTLGALAAALAYFGAAAVADRRDRNARLLALIAGAALLQLGIEVARAFIAYAYPWHLVRVAVIALLAGITSLLAAYYAADRFAPEWKRGLTASTAAAVIAALILVPWYDIKAMAAILAGATALGISGVRGLIQRRSGAWAALAGSLFLVGLMAWQLTVFLDQAYYLIVATLLVALVAEQVLILRTARHRRDAEAERATALEERLRRATEAGEPIVRLKDGTRLHPVPESDILYARAADDYCDVALTDGRTILVTMTLARLLETLPGQFLRVHKSYAVNRRHVTAVAPRPGGGRQLVLDQGEAIPVGRTYGEAIAALGPS